MRATSDSTLGYGSEDSEYDYYSLFYSTPGCSWSSAMARPQGTTKFKCVSYSDKYIYVPDQKQETKAILSTNSYDFYFSEDDTRSIYVNDTGAGAARRKYDNHLDYGGDKFYIGNRSPVGQSKAYHEFYYVKQVHNPSNASTTEHQDIPLNDTKYVVF